MGILLSLITKLKTKQVILLGVVVAVLLSSLLYLAFGSLQWLDI